MTQVSLLLEPLPVAAIWLKLKQLRLQLDFSTVWLTSGSLHDTRLASQGAKTVWNSFSKRRLRRPRETERFGEHEVPQVEVNTVLMLCCWCEQPHRLQQVEKFREEFPPAV